MSSDRDAVLYAYENVGVEQDVGEPDAVVYAYENVGVTNDSPGEVGRVVGYAAPLRVATVYAYENVEEEGA